MFVPQLLLTFQFNFDSSCPPTFLKRQRNLFLGWVVEVVVVGVFIVFITSVLYEISVRVFLRVAGCDS